MIEHALENDPRERIKEVEHGRFMGTTEISGVAGDDPHIKTVQMPLCATHVAAREFREFRRDLDTKNPAKRLHRGQHDNTSFSGTIVEKDIEIRAHRDVTHDCAEAPVRGRGIRFVEIRSARARHRNDFADRTDSEASIIEALAKQVTKV